MFIYSLIYCLFLPFVVIHTFFKNKFSLKQKLGFFNHTTIATKKTIHIHCVSVGEFNASIPLINKLKNNHTIIITTTTKTGASACKKYYKNQIQHYYFPFDLPFFINRFIKQINPKISLILETEVWPNFLNICQKKNIKTILINARLSNRSFNKYFKVDKFSNKVMSKFQIIATQDKYSDNNFKKLKLLNSTITGNLKFDIKPIINTEKLVLIKNIIQNRNIVVCASTHKNEEKLIIQSYIKNPCNQLLVIIPRHPQRFNEVELLLNKNNINYKKQSTGQKCNQKTQVLLADSMGFVLEFYSLCDIAFIGGSLVKTGGHNMLEAIVFNKLTIFGKYTFNFKDISEQLVKNTAAVQINTADELFNRIQNLNSNQSEMEKIKNNAYIFLKNNIGTSDKLINIINKILNT